MGCWRWNPSWLHSRQMPSPLSYCASFHFLHFGGGTSGGAQGSLLAPYSGIVGRLKGTYGMPGIELSHAQAKYPSCCVIAPLSTHQPFPRSWLLGYCSFIVCLFGVYLVCSVYCEEHLGRKINFLSALSVFQVDAKKHNFGMRALALSF